MFVVPDLYLECPLPSISSLLENSRITETDSFVICVQIHSPIGPFFPQQPSAYYVPKELLDGLEGSLDNASQWIPVFFAVGYLFSTADTGDVKFICLERLEQARNSSPGVNNVTHPRSPSSSSSSSLSPFSSQTTARKRVIYAHSDIISRRSDYFATMLASSFAENTSGLVPGERKLHTIIVEEADFETIYWLLKWVYGNWLLFKEFDDPRVAVDGIGEGWSTRWLNARGGEWDWKTFRKTNVSDGSNAGTRDETGSVTSACSRKSSEGDVTTGNRDKQLNASTTSTSPTSRPQPSARSVSNTKPGFSSATRQGVAPVPRRPPTGNATNTSRVSMMAPHSNTKPAPLSTSNFPASSHYPASPHAQRQHFHPSSVTNTVDPHPHPAPPPHPASALAMYQVAHRYHIPGLAALALDHMMSTITPQSSFPLLLATSVWDELRGFVEVK